MTRDRQNGRRSLSKLDVLNKSANGFRTEDGLVPIISFWPSFASSMSVCEQEVDRLLEVEPESLKYLRLLPNVRRGAEHHLTSNGHCGGLDSSRTNCQLAWDKERQNRAEKRRDSSAEIDRSRLVASGSPARLSCRGRHLGCACVLLET